MPLADYWRFLAVAVACSRNLGLNALLTGARLVSPVTIRPLFVPRFFYSFRDMP